MPNSIVTVDYDGQEIVGLKNGETATLLTDGKRCISDIIVRTAGGESTLDLPQLVIHRDAESAPISLVAVPPNALLTADANPCSFVEYELPIGDSLFYAIPTYYDNHGTDTYIFDIQFGSNVPMEISSTTAGVETSSDVVHLTTTTYSVLIEVSVSSHYV